MPRTVLSIALVAAAAAVVSSRPTYVARLPNGANVPGVAALGHVNPLGGGANNDFGLDFASAGKSWTTEFCQKDSDGDGQTNGEELGDPCCKWVQDSNAVVQWTDGVSHPGNASSKSDPSLWANVTCDSSASKGSNASTVEAGSTTDSKTATPASGDASRSSSSAASPSITSAMYAAVGVAAAVAAFVM